MIAQSDMTGRFVVITGASDGIGKVAARRLAERGAHIIIVGRESTKTENVVREIHHARFPGVISWEVADLSLQRSVRELADRLGTRLPRIDVLVNNAGAIFSERKVTAEGFERTFALNHLAYFTLTLSLLPNILAAGTPGHPARIINVASRAHVGAKLDLTDLQSERSFRAWRTYNNSKLENILFTRALSRRLDSSRVVTHSLHPGLVASQFAVSNNGLWGRFMRTLMNLRAITPERGSDTIVHLATSADAAARTGLYWDKCHVITPSVAAQSDDDAERLWQASLQLTGFDARRLASVMHNESTERPPTEASTSTQDSAR